jgi:16S rRNA (cytosine1402-N4)-methyltransferase
MRPIICEGARKRSHRRLPSFARRVWDRDQRSLAVDPGVGYKHVPALVEEITQFLRPRPGGVYADATLGEGGHGEVLLRASAPSGRLIGIDRDAEVLEVARQRLRPFGERVDLVHGHAADLRSILDALGGPQVDGILFDLGVSSYQLETAERGFSFARAGPLDMRMDRTTEQTAAMLVNTLRESELVGLIQRYGEERWARRIARAILRARHRTPLQTTQDLAVVITQVVPPSRQPPRLHPATRTFQALRIAVNQELVRLAESLDAAIACLSPGARLCVIAYHSLEDRMVKRTFQAYATSREETPLRVRLLTRKPVTSTLAERRVNRRARSAKLRVIERM